MRIFKIGNEYKAIKETVRKYYKYTYTSWTQPTLSANGTLGGSSFAVEAESNYSDYPAYHALDSTGWVGQRSTLPYFIFYNPKPLKVSNLTFSKGSYLFISCWILNFELYGSNDGSTWTFITQCNNPNPNTSPVSHNISVSTGYKYYKIVPLTRKNDYPAIANLVITAQEENVTESTSSDYDFYKDIDEYKAFN